jgi:glyoxylase-like metal-dependent hydrolase (beta-lactamase superfamily II)
MLPPDFLLAVAPGVYAIDTGFVRPRFDAAYLVTHQGRAAFIDTGPNAAVPRLLAALDALGIGRDAVDWVIPTHVHLDHAGGLGLLMSHLPVAQALVHPRGARHMIDPTALAAGARAVYGDEVVARTYGELLPVRPERVSNSHDGMVVDLAGRQLVLIDTPGHARHHHCIWDETSRGWFTGDTFGIAYPEFTGPRGPFIFPTSSPVQFELAAMRASITRMLEADPLCLFPTHFGRLDDPKPLAAQLFEQLDEIEAGSALIKARTARGSAERQDALQAMAQRLLLAAARRAGSPLTDEQALPLLTLDIGLNAQGLAIWLDKQAGQPAVTS